MTRRRDFERAKKRDQARTDTATHGLPKGYPPPSQKIRTARYRTTCHACAQTIEAGHGLYLLLYGGRTWLARCTNCGPWSPTYEEDLNRTRTPR